MDLQVNGYAGLDFNADTLDAAALNAVCRRLRDEGVQGILATLISDHVEAMTARLRGLVEARRHDPLVQQAIVGFHLEGPFINPADGYRGAHRLDAIRPADVDAAQHLLEAGQGLVRLVTLAPECDSGLRVTGLLARRGVVVSAGHCNPSLNQLDAAMDAGLSMFTHLGNGCPRLLDRHDNIIQRALARAGRLWLCFIADGVHVPWPALGNYLRGTGLEHCIVVSDATAAAGLGPGTYQLGHWHFTVGDDLAAWAPDGGHLLGSAMPLPTAAHRLSTHLGLATAQLERLTLHNPKTAIGL